jgi:three-Cys-motif partner protein
MIRLTSTDGQVFGGTWTEIKLNCIEKYLQAYIIIFKKNPKASFLQTYYIDGFAGSGTWCPPESKEQDMLEFSAYQREVMDGSARKALALASPFDHYLFIETSDYYVKTLQSLKTDFPHLADRINIANGDANLIIKNFCNGFNRNNPERAVLFLDPYGMQVNWSTVEAVGKSNAIDMWWLFPVGIAVSRLLKKDQIPVDICGNRLDATFGTTEWRDRFYCKVSEKKLFGVEEKIIKQVDWHGVSLFNIEQLKKVFKFVTEEPLVLRNSIHSPMYTLCFASQNKNGHKIAQEIINKQIKDQNYVN